MVDNPSAETPWFPVSSGPPKMAKRGVSRSAATVDAGNGTSSRTRQDVVTEFNPLRAVTVYGLRDVD
jgi:hypothetical protein